VRQRFEYALAWTAIEFLGLLPRSVARWAAAQFAAFLFRLHPRWRRISLYNLRLAFPNWQESQRERVVHDMVRNLGWLAAEFAHFPQYTRRNIEDVIILDGFENFSEAERRGKGVLFLTGHMGAWELKPFAHALYSKPLHFLVRPIDNPRVDALINHYRGLCGNRPINKNESARAVLQTLRAGGVVGVLADQNTAPEEAVFVDFFGIPAATTSGLARLARHTGAAIVPVYSYWDKSIGKYRLRYDAALELPHTDAPEADVRASTALFNRSIEEYIRRFPDQWLWVHRRWKNRPPGEPPIYPVGEKK
jgi:Kdo2-lipid IVA lauroyltransferase/acyltransferase